MKLRLRIDAPEIELEWSTGKDAKDERHPAALAFAAVATPLVLDWLKRQGFAWWDRGDKAPAASSDPSSSTSSAPPAAAAADDSNDDRQVVDGNDAAPNHATATV